jgi:hypothetical protein
MLISASLQPSVISSGILPYNAIFHGDHHPCFLDLVADQLFAGDTPPLAPPCRRSLQLHDPRLVTKYKEVLHDQLLYHISTLKTAAQQQSWMIQHTQEYENLDKLITESILYAERCTGKRYTKRYEWSPTLLQSIEKVRYWRLLLKRSKGIKIHNSTIHRAKIQAGMPSNTEDDTRQPSIITQLREALAKMRSFQKSHTVLRKTYLNRLAEAIVFQKNPHLAEPENSDCLYSQPLTRLIVLISGNIVDGCIKELAIH